MPERKDICFRLTSDLSNEVNSAKMVEEQLIETCVKLNETESSSIQFNGATHLNTAE